MNEKIIGVIAVIVVLAGGWYLLQKNTGNTPPTDQSLVATSTTPSTATTTPASPTEVTVTYSDKGFSPKDITVSLGTTVTFVNQSTGKMWVASAVHPTHVVYSGTSLSQHCPDTANSAFDECAGEAPGTSFSFTFNKEGVWKYHDHINASRTGSVTVTAAAAATDIGANANLEIK